MLDIKCVCIYMYRAMYNNNNIVLGRRPFVVLREKHEIGICYQIETVDTFKAPSIPVTKLGLI